MDKKLWMGTNLKMYKGVQDTVDYLSLLDRLTRDIQQQVQLFVIPSYTALDRASSIVAGSGILLGAQNMHPNEEGQFTGEISPRMLQEIGVHMVEIGHSERRNLFGETNEDTNLKVLSALEHGFIALLCIGEREEHKQADAADEILATQIKMGLLSVSPEMVDRLIIAYEPVWSIGLHGTPATPEYVEKRMKHVRVLLNSLFGGAYIPLLYGGSVSPQNASQLIQLKNIDGLFTGRAAWQAENFNRLIRHVLSDRSNH